MNPVQKDFEWTALEKSNYLTSSKEDSVIKLLNLLGFIFTVVILFSLNSLSLQSDLTESGKDDSVLAQEVLKKSLSQQGFFYENELTLEESYELMAYCKKEIPLYGELTDSTLSLIEDESLFISDKGVAILLDISCVRKEKSFEISVIKYSTVQLVNKDHSNLSIPNFEE